MTLSLAQFVAEFPDEGQLVEFKNGGSIVEHLQLGMVTVRIYADAWHADGSGAQIADAICEAGDSCPAGGSETILAQPARAIHPH